MLEICGMDGRGMLSARGIYPTCRQDGYRIALTAVEADGCEIALMVIGLVLNILN